MMEHTCKNCHYTFKGKYCSQCGEKVYTDKDRSVLHLFEEAFHFLTHFEGTFFNTLKAIFTKPGKLSYDYCNGVRKKYFKPLSFFFLLVVLYLLFPYFQGLNMKLQFHESHGLYGAYAKEKVTKLLAERHFTAMQLEESFHHAGEKTSKFLLFIVIPFAAIVSMLMGFRKRKYYFEHFIFSTEICAIAILWGFLLMPLLLWLLQFFTGNLMASEELLFYIMFIPLMLYIIIGAKKFFDFKWWFSVLYAVVFCLSLIFFIQFIYKFVLFIIAINLV